MPLFGKKSKLKTNNPNVVRLPGKYVTKESTNFVKSKLSVQFLFAVL